MKELSIEEIDKKFDELLDSCSYEVFNEYFEPDENVQKNFKILARSSITHRVFRSWEYNNLSDYFYFRKRLSNKYGSTYNIEEYEQINNDWVTIQ